MKTIYKYPLYNVPGINHVSLPANALIVSVGLDPNNALCLWAFVNPKNVAYDIRKILVTGTGFPIVEPSLRFMSTVRINEYMWHVLEVLE
jgi:hypothetical protein